MAQTPKKRGSPRRAPQAAKGRSAARSSGAAAASPGVSNRWTFLSNHAHVLICLAGDADIRIRDVATRIGITERAVIKILSDLEQEGLVVRYREGRRNSYELRLDQPLRHPIEAHCSVGELVSLIQDHAPGR